MKKTIQDTARLLLFSLFLAIAGVAMYGCLKEPACPRQNDEPDEASIQFHLLPESLTRIDTKSGNILRDVNLYLYDPYTAETHHTYTTDLPNVALVLSTGEYELYALANYGTNLGQMAPAELERLVVDIATESDLSEKPLMVARQSVTVRGKIPINVPLRRCFSRVNLSFSVAPGFDSGFQVQSLRLMNAAARLVPFGNFTAQAETDLMDYTRQSPADSPITFYLAENLSGENPGITDQRHKNRENAPAYATYLSISGQTSSGETVEYTVFLGENNTTDFNVHRNTDYQLSVTLRGLNEADTRVSVTRLSAAPITGTFESGESARTTLIAECSNNTDNWLEMTCELISGNGTVLLDGTPIPYGVPFRFLSEGQSRRSATVDYSQSGEGTAMIRFRATDRYGNEQTQIIQVQYEGELSVTLTPYKKVISGHLGTLLILDIDKPGYTGSYRIESTILSGDGYITNTAPAEPSNGQYYYTVYANSPGTIRVQIRVSKTASGQSVKTVEASLPTEMQTIYININPHNNPDHSASVILATSEPLPEDIEVTFWCQPYLKYNGTDQGIKYEEKTETVTMQKNTQQQEVRFALPSPTGNVIGLWFIRPEDTQIRSFNKNSDRNGLILYAVGNPT